MLLNGTTGASQPLVEAQAAGLWAGLRLLRPAAPGTAAAANSSLGAYVTFADPNAGAPPPPIDGPSNSVVFTVRVAVSTTSAAAAVANLAAEQQQQQPSGQWLSAPAVATLASDAWEAVLGAVQVGCTMRGLSVLPHPLSIERPRHSPSPQVDLPTDAAAGVTDAAALAEGLRRSGVHLPPVPPDAFGRAGAPLPLRDEPAAALAAALQATPEGLTLALERGWLVRAGAEGEGGRLTASELLALPAGAWGAPEDAESAQASLLAAGVAVDVAAAAAAFRAARENATEAAGAVVGAASSDAAVFYTLLYISLCAPSTYSDSAGGGAYWGFDAALHDAPAPRRFVSDLSLWDTYRSQSAWLGLHVPAAATDVAWSLVTMAAQGGRLPRWPFANLYTGTMVGEHGAVILADCVAKAQCAVDAAAAYAVVKAAITTQDAEVRALVCVCVWEGGVVRGTPCAARRVPSLLPPWTPPPSPRRCAARRVPL